MSPSENIEGMERVSHAAARVFQHGVLLSMKQKEYREWVLAFLGTLLESDTRKGDVTIKALFPEPGAPMESQIIAKEDTIAAGLEELAVFCGLHGIKLSPGVKDGERVKAGAPLARLRGTAAKLLATERLRLDALGRMSGIAALTRRLSRKSRGIPLAATRKTPWGLLDKKAVFVGGGWTHRLGAWQAVLIKDNHLAALRNTDVSDPFPEAIALATENSGKKEALFVEVETQSVKEAHEVIRIYQKTKSEIPLAVLLDNFPPRDIREVLKTLQKRELRRKILVEVSGGITEKTLSEYAAAGPDLISLGLLTHSPRAADFCEQIVLETRQEPRP